MRIVYKNERFKAYLHNPKELAKDFPPAVVKAVPKRLEAIKNTTSLWQLRKLAGHSKKLKGIGENQYRIELDGQFRLLLEVVNKKPLTVRIMAIGDFHKKGGYA